MDESRTCSRCGVEYPPYLVAMAFQRQRREDASSLRKRICRPCEQTSRDARKSVDRWMVKARDVVRRHAPRLGVTKDDLVDRYGWDVKLLAHEAEHAYGNGCGYCGEPYREMGHGLADITLDVMDRAREPSYRMNTKWCCQTCNRKKGVMTPEAFELDRQVYAQWSRQSESMRVDPQGHGRLFWLEAV